MTPGDLVLAGLAAFLAGVVNALAGGGTLLSFPMLLALGVPPVAANVTNTVALSPGYIGGTLAQRDDLRGQGRRLRALMPVAAGTSILRCSIRTSTGASARGSLPRKTKKTAVAAIGSPSLERTRA